MRKSYEPFTLPKYPALQDDINKLSMAIKLHFIVKEDVANREKLQQVKKNYPKPEWIEIVKLLDKVQQALSDERTNPIKF